MGDAGEAQQVAERTETYGLADRDGHGLTRLRSRRASSGAVDGDRERSNAARRSVVGAVELVLDLGAGRTTVVAGVVDRTVWVVLRAVRRGRRVTDHVGHRP